MELDRYISIMSSVVFLKDPSLLCTIGRHLISLWGIPKRAYHTTEHLDNCLKEFDEWSRAPRTFSYRRPSIQSSIEVALWYHDAVYSPVASDNEQKSVEWAVEDMIALKASATAIHDVSRLILATKHNVYPNQQEDEQVIVDIDLSILGQSPDTYDHYRENIRIEYYHVNYGAYRKGRSAFLRRFLDRASIYQTPFFKDKYEAPARENIQRELDFLSA